MPFIALIRFSILTVLVGIVAGIGAIFFRELIAFFHITDSVYTLKLTRRGHVIPDALQAKIVV